VPGKAYSRALVGKLRSYILPIRNGLKQGDALSPLLFNFDVEYALRRVQVKPDGLKLYGTHQLQVYADNVNILGRRVHTIKNNAGALIVARKVTGLEGIADKTNYIVMSQDQKLGRSHDIKIDNSSTERVKEFRY
jgi:hypothetical protein